MSLQERMGDFSFDVVSETEPTKTEAQEYNKDQVTTLIKEAMTALEGEAWDDYWAALDGAAGLMSASYADETDEEIADSLNRKLGGPDRES